MRAAGFFPRLAAYALDRLILGAALFLPRMFLLADRMGGDVLSRAVLFRYSWSDIVLWAVCAGYSPPSPAPPPARRPWGSP